MTIDVSAICRHVLGEKVGKGGLVADIVRVATARHRRRGAEAAVATLQMVDHYARQFGLSRREAVERLAGQKAVVEKIVPRFTEPPEPAPEVLLAQLSARYPSAVGRIAAVEPQDGSADDMQAAPGSG